MKEEWKDIIGYKGIYKISSLGRIKSLKRKYCRKTFVMKPSKNADGYLVTALRKNGISKTVSISRLVAIHFLENPKKFKEVNHKNSIRTDNRVNNLEWCDRKYNVNHSYKYGFCSRVGSLNNRTKLDDNDIIFIREINKAGLFSYREIGLMFNLSKSGVYNICKKRNWSHL